MDGPHELSFPADHPAFAGHFPGEPILPGAVLLDAVLQRIAADLGWDLGCCEVASAKFLSIVRPGAQLQLRYQPGPRGAVGFEVHAAGRSIASGTLLTHGRPGGGR